MSGIYKIVLSVLIFGGALFAGYRLYIFLNEKIQDSQSGWALLIYSLLLFATCGVLFFGSFVVLAYLYTYLK